MVVVQKYGPLALIVALLLGVGALVVLDAGDGDGGDTSAVAAGQGDDGLLPGAPGAPEPTGRMPLSYAEAEAAGTVTDHDWGERCDPDTGHVRLPSVYAAPCVPVFPGGDNGGATTPGVTAEAIKVVRYVAEQSSDLTALIGDAVPETADQQTQTLRDFLEIQSSRAELYGRRIELVEYHGTGAADDVVVAQADATQIAAELQPFLVIGGPQLDRGTFAQELADHGIVCLDCAGALSAELMEPLVPYAWGMLPSGEQFFQALAAWSDRLPDDRTVGGRPRKIGAVHFDQDPPVFAVPEDQYPEGVALIESYVLDIGRLPQKAAELVAALKAADVTTVVFLGDPIMPIYLTQAATQQGWYPEWIFTGTAYTDTNLFGRMYDPAQMAHAFGISQLPAPLVEDLQEPVRLYRWYFGDADARPPAAVTYPALAFAAGFVVHGVHMAGPDLTPETFARGQFRIPPAGGGPTAPQVSFGDWGLFPSPDYQGIDDAVEIWWDPDTVAPGEDERGVWRRAHDGERFTGAGDAPDPAPFDPDHTVTVLDRLPDEDTPPDHPPPPRGEPR